MLDLPPEGCIRRQQAFDEWVGPHGGGDQPDTARRVLALDELGSKERLAEDTLIKLAGLGLADDNIAAVKGEWSACWKPLSGAVDSEYAVYLAGL